MIRSKARRTGGMLAGALLVVGGSLAGAMRSGAIVPLMTSLRDPQSLFAERSPGARQTGELVNIKADYAADSGGDGGENDLAAVGPHPAFAFGTPGMIDGVPVLASNGADRVPSYSGEGDGGYLGFGGAGGGGGGGHRGHGGHGGGAGGGGSGGGGAGVGGGGGSGSGGGSGGGGTGGGGTGGGGTGGSGGSGGSPGGGGPSGGGGGGNTPPIATPVPEPQTWLLMTLGMALIGLAMRREVRSRPPLPGRRLA